MASLHQVDGEEYQEEDEEDFEAESEEDDEETLAEEEELARREAKESGADSTYTSPTARSFVPFYAQRLSAACVLNGARAIQKSLKRKAARRRSATVAA